ncbi:hypothetical protein [Frankia sp. R43]|nr:hypothetical protein [Frankia sp. R43]
MTTSRPTPPSHRDLHALARAAVTGLIAGATRALLDLLLSQ